MTVNNRWAGADFHGVRGRLSGKLFLPLLIIAAALSFAGESSASDKSYDHPDIGIIFRFQRDGSVIVDETRAYRFDGSFSWAQFEKSTLGKYGKYGVDFMSVQDAGTGEDLQFEKSARDGAGILKWFYSAQDETKRFLIRYRINGAVQRYEDAAQFYWKAVEDDHEYIGSVIMEIVPPAPSPALFKVFVHSTARPGTLDIAEDRSRATVRQASIRRNSYVELRVLMDSSLFTDTPVMGGESHSSLLEDERRTTEAWREAEAKRVERASRRANEFKNALIGGIAFVLVFALFYKWYFDKFGREYRIEYGDVYERQPPRPIPPSVLPAILTQSGVQITEMAKSFTAALIDCARFGYLEISEKEEKTLVFKRKTLHYDLTDKGISFLKGMEVTKKRNERSLTDFEKDVLYVVFREAGDGDSVSGGEIEKWAAKTSGRKTKYYEFMESRAGELRKGFEREHFRIDDPVSERARKGFILISLVSGAGFAGISFLFTRHPVSILFGSLVAVAGMILSIPLARRTREASMEYRRWMAFKKFMGDFSAMKDAGHSLISMWEEYLVYAVALGVADKLLSNLKLFAREYNTPIPAVVWFHPMPGSAADALNLEGINSMDALNRSIDNLQSLSKALSTSTSTGGGFSGGGGGGGGGGSSSAG